MRGRGRAAAPWAESLLVAAAGGEQRGPLGVVGQAGAAVNVRAGRQAEQLLHADQLGPVLARRLGRRGRRRRRRGRAARRLRPGQEVLHVGLGVELGRLVQHGQQAVPGRARGVLDVTSRHTETAKDSPEHLLGGHLAALLALAVDDHVTLEVLLAPVLLHAPAPLDERQAAARAHLGRALGDGGQPHAGVVGNGQDVPGQVQDRHPPVCLRIDHCRTQNGGRLKGQFGHPEQNAYTDYISIIQT